MTRVRRLNVPYIVSLCSLYVCLLFIIFRQVRDKNLCRCFPAPVCRVFPDHLIIMRKCNRKAPAKTARERGAPAGPLRRFEVAVAAALVVVILLPQPGGQPVAEEPAVPEEDDFEYWNQLRRVHGWSEVAATISRQRHGDAAPHTPVKSRPKRNKRRAVTGSGKAQGATAAAAAAAEAAPAAAAAAAPAAAAAAAAEVAAEVVIEGEEAVSSERHARVAERLEAGE